jgi:glycosyltransferase involved in cell wall biosynthesis
VVVSNSSVAFAGALAARIAGRPHIWIIHELLHHPQAVVKFIFGNRLLVRIIGRLSAKVIVNSKKTGEAFFPDFPVEIITNGINWSRLARETHQLILFKNLKIVDRNLEKVKEKEELTRLLQRRKEIQSQIRVKWNLNHQDQFLGVVGKLKREKGQDLAIYALARLKEIFPRLKLLFIGEPADKVYYSYLRHLLKKLGLEKRVVFLGYVKELYSLLLGLDILLVPSRQESFGRVIIEAMAVGVPVVAFRQGGIEEIIKDGHNGYLARDFSAESLGEKVSLLLSEPFLAGKFMIEGYRTVRTKYDLHNQVKKFEGILEQWIG